MLYGIDRAEEIGITFSSFDRELAAHIMETEYAPEVLLSYVPLFPCYMKGERKGRAIGVDFAYLYDLGIMDAELRQLLLAVCLDLEQSLRAVFLVDCHRANVGDELVQGFVDSDADYLRMTYTPDNIDILAQDAFAGVPFEALPLCDFLETLQFGTFQRLIRYFYSIQAPALYGKRMAPFENGLDALRHIRNASAHNTSLINQFGKVGTFRRDSKLLSILGRSGVCHKTLTTNMSKPVVHDIIGLLRLYGQLMPPLRAERVRKQFSALLMEHCTAYSSYYKKSPTLLSVYPFLLQSIPILLQNIS